MLSRRPWRTASDVHTIDVILRPSRPRDPIAGPERPRRNTLQDKVCASLREGLMVDAFMPGQTVTLRKLARALGTSPMPVRDAVNQMIAASALELLPNRSISVPCMTRSRFRELTRVRVVLEGLAAQEACCRANDHLIRRLDRINDELTKAIAARDLLRCLQKNRAFHFTLYAASSWAVLLPLIETLWLQVGPFMYLSLATPGVRWNASQHRAVLSALRRKDRVAARRAIEKDVGETARYLSSIIGFAGERLNLPILSRQPLMLKRVDRRPAKGRARAHEASSDVVGHRASTPPQHRRVMPTGRS